MPSASIGSRSRASTTTKPTAATSTATTAAAHAAIAAPLDERVRRAAERRGASTAPATSKCDGRVRVAGLRHGADRDEHRQRGDRQVDQEDPAPVGVLDQRRRRRTGRSRPRCRSARTRPRSPARGPPATKAPWIIARLPGVSSAPPTPWSTRAAISTSGLGAMPHSSDAAREPDGPDHEDPAPAEPVAQRPAEQDQAGEREQVAVGDPLQLGEARVEVLADGAQRDVDDGAVEEGDARAERGRRDDRPSRRRPHPDGRWRRINHIQKGSLLPCPLRSRPRPSSGWPSTSRGSPRSTRRSSSTPSTSPCARPREFESRFGHVLDYMARVELEVDRNVLELTTMLPDPPEIDRHFYADVWQPQEIQHGLILDRLQVELGRAPADADLDSIGLKLKILGALAHIGAVPGRLPDALLPDRHGHRALRGARLQPAAPRHPRHGRGRDRQHGHRPDQAPGARPLRLLPALGPRAVGRARRLAALDGPADAAGLLRPGRRQQRRARRPTSAT